MPRAAARFTQTEIDRVLQAVVKSGANMEVVIEGSDRIRIVPRSADPVDIDRTPGPKPKGWD